VAKRTKKRTVQRRRRRSLRRYTLYYFLAFFLIAAVGVTLSLTVLFPVKTIEVVGNTAYSDSELVEATGVELGDNLLRMRPKRIARELYDRYPYLDEVKVRRTLPDTVTIRVAIAEERAALRDAETGRFAVLSRKGRALRTDLALCPEGMIAADGFTVRTDGETEKNGEAPLPPLQAGAPLAAAEEARFEALLQILDALDAQGLAEGINVIDLRDLFDIRMLYRGRLAILLGAADDLDYKIRFAAAAIENEVDETTVGALDVSQKPTARLREYDIYTDENWPFADDLRAEYERRIVRSRPQAQQTSPQEQGDAAP